MLIAKPATTGAPTRGVPNAAPSRRWPVALAATGGGAAVLVGAFLPWLTLFAGLRPYAGTDGPHGWVLAAGGAIGTLAGIAYRARGGAPLRWAIGRLGFALLAGAGWLAVNLVGAQRALAADPLLVAALGPGLFVALAGAGLLFATLFLPDARP